MKQFKKQRGGHRIKQSNIKLRCACSASAALSAKGNLVFGGITQGNVCLLKWPEGAKGCSKSLNILQAGIWGIAMRLFLKISALSLEENFAGRVHGLSIASVILGLDSVHIP